jgi:hypothetical protein
MGIGTRVWQWLSNSVRACVIVGIFAVGLIMMLVASLRMHGKELYVILSVGGLLIVSAFVTMVVYAFRKKSLEVWQDERVRNEEEGRNLKQKVNELRIERERLKKEVEEERSKRVRVLEVGIIADLAICQMECKITKCYDRYFDVNEKELSTETDAKKRFIGALTAKFTAKYGIDLMKELWFKRDDSEKVVYFAGAEPSFRGLQGFPQVEWECGIGLSRGWLSKWIIDEESRELEIRCKEEYQKTFVESLQKGPEQPEWIKEPLRRTIRILLARFFAPPGYKVQFPEKVSHGFVPFRKYPTGPARPLLP